MVPNSVQVKEEQEEGFASSHQNQNALSSNDFQAYDDENNNEK